MDWEPGQVASPGLSIYRTQRTQRGLAKLSGPSSAFIGSFSQRGLSWRSVALSSPGWANGEFGLTAARGAEDVAAEGAGEGGLGVREDSGDVVALGAFNIQEEAVGRLYEFLKFVHVIFRDGVRVQKVHFHSD